MKTTLTAIALAAMPVQPAASITFPSFTTIYLGSGVYDDGGGENAGIATSIQCSNVSGQATLVRVVFLDINGAVRGLAVLFNLAHGDQFAASTHLTVLIETNAGTGAMQGTVNIESRQSGVFCTAAVINAASPNLGVPLNLIRVNPHPGTVE